MKPVSPARALGIRCEQDAANWLSERGAMLIARNFRCRGGEIDLIVEEMQPGGKLELVFVEVRARSTGGWVDGIESVDHRKRSRLLHAARLFLTTYRGKAESVRFDILAWDNSGWHRLEDAWWEGI